MNRRGHANLKMWLMGAAAIGVPTAFGIFAINQAAFADGKPTFGTHAKKQAAKVSPAVAAEPPQLLPVPDAPMSVIQTVSDTRPLVAAGTGQKSEVMKQLELLYEKDGREMPDLQTIQPVPTGATSAERPATAKPTVPAGQPAAPTAASFQPRTQMIHSKSGQSNPVLSNGTPATPPTASESEVPPRQPSKNPVTGFFKKLIPGNKEPKTAAAPPNYQPNVAPVPPATKTSARSPEYQPAQIRPGQAPIQQGVPGKLNAQQSGLPVEKAAPTLSGVPTQPTTALSDIPPSPMSDFGSELSEPSTSSTTTLPPLLSQPQSASLPLSAESGNTELVLPKPAGSGNLESPFTEMSEAEADEEEEDEAGPFTGLTLDDEAKPPVAPSAQATNKPKGDAPQTSEASNDPFADELRKLGILPPQEPMPVAEDDATKLALPSPEAPALEGIGDEVTREKMLKIRERGGMKGLKGFCPVTLHDERELVDAKTEFHATYRGQKFHFASAEAKDKFEEDPSVYAPAAYGADVVALTRDKDVVEGSLDHAAWFKGRLYLFGTQDSHDAFVANPVQYATPAGIE